MRITVNLDGLTFGELYRFVDHARSAGVPSSQAVIVESEDNIGNEVGAHALAAELGDVDELSRPVLLDRRDLERYTTALERELQQESGEEDLKVLRELLEDFWGAAHPAD